MENAVTAIVPYSEIEKMGNAIARSGLFGITRSEQAVALMLVAQAEGLHPAIAARDYHIIEGRPTLKADAMLSRFIAHGGSVEWHELSDTIVSATFSHPNGGKAKIDWDIPRAKRAEVYREKTSTGKTGMWIKYPRQMLRARVISEGVRTVNPNANSGLYTPEEIDDVAEDVKTISVSPVAAQPVQVVSTATYSDDLPFDNSEPVTQSIPSDMPQGIIENVATKNGTKKDGSNWTRYGIKINGIIYGTFDIKTGEMAARSIGESCTFTFEEDEKYKNLTSLILIQER